MKNSAYLLWSSIFVFIILLSCSKEDAMLDTLTPEEKLEGEWVGVFHQGNRGSIIITINFSELITNQASGTWITKDHDLTDCDTDIWDCESFECRGTLSYTETIGSLIKFIVFTDSGPCWEESISEIKFIDDNTIDYTNEVPGQSFLNGTMERQ